MKQYCVEVDITMAKNIYIEAENEHAAKEMVDEMISNNPYEYANNFSCLVGHEVIEVYETR